MATKYLSIDRVVEQTKWSDGLKKSMTQDFVKSGYGNVAPLIGSDFRETSKNIQTKVRDFSSGKNTYLQANQIAEIIHSMSTGTPRRYYKRKTQTGAPEDGEVIKDCSGWTITKKNLDDGRIVYNANIKADTPKNKGDWAAIKGDVYVETTFKWNFKFQKFERWGQIENESKIIEKLCQVLAKYYEGGEQPVPAPEAPTPDASLPEVGDRFIVKTEKSGIVYEITKMDMGTVFIKPDGRDFEVPYTFSEVKNNFTDGRWVKIQDEEQETPAPEAPKQQKSIKEIAEEVINLEFNIWNKLDIKSGSQLVRDEKLQEKYADEVRKVIIPVLEKYSLRDSQRIDFAATLADENAHKLNNSLSLIGYYGEDTKQEAILDYNKNSEWWLNPKYYIAEETKTAKSKADIEKAIKGLQFLADKGNDKAKKAIIGLKILLNK